MSLPIKNGDFPSFFIVDFPSCVNGPMFNRYVGAAQISGDLLRSLPAEMLRWLGTALVLVMTHLYQKNSKNLNSFFTWVYNDM